MQYPRLLRTGLAAFLALISCAPARRPEEHRHDAIGAIRERMLMAALHVAGGTGIAIWGDDTRTLILTAGHVVNTSPAVWITRYDNGSFESFIGLTFALSPRFDLGLVVVNRPFAEFVALPIASDETYRSIRGARHDDSEDYDGDLVLAAGWPGTRPALTTIGHVRDPNYREGDRGPWLFHSASGWFGFSGGPVVLARTGEIVGVVVEIKGEPGMWDSSMMVSVRSIEVNMFVKEALAHLR